MSRILTATVKAVNNSQLLQLRRLAADALIEYVNDEKVYGLARALESALEGIENYDLMADKVQAYEETSEELEEDVKDLSGAIRDIYRVTKSASLSDVKRLAEIQEICEEADVDLTAIV